MRSDSLFTSRESSIPAPWRLDDRSLCPPSIRKLHPEAQSRNLWHCRRLMDPLCAAQTCRIVSFTSCAQRKVPNYELHPNDVTSVLRKIFSIESKIKLRNHRTSTMRTSLLSNEILISTRGTIVSFNAKRFYYTHIYNTILK